VKDANTRFIGGARRPVKSLGWLKLGLVTGACLFAGLTQVSRAQTFTSPIVLAGNWGSVTNDNTSVVATNGPSIAGARPRATLWYQWTPISDGDVEMDTIGSYDSTYGLPLDTVLAVFTGTNLLALNQVAANDDLFPVYNNNAINAIGVHSTMQVNVAGSSDWNQYLNQVGYGLGFYGPGILPILYYAQSQFGPTYNGPSHLHFIAHAGTTYYIGVDTKVPTGTFTNFTNLGNIILNWAYQSAGVFRFATEDRDWWTGAPIYQTSEKESYPPTGLHNDANSTIVTYYQYNVPGVLVTVTRGAGSTGRQLVDYQTVDGTALGGYLSANDAPAISNLDYIPVSGTLVFDDYEMSKTILVPLSQSRWLTGSFQSNTEFAVTLSNPRPDPNESSAVSAPRVDPFYGQVLVRILNVNADPYGPDIVPVISTNGFDTNNLPILVTNYVQSLSPTNVVINFEKANYRVPADVNDPANPDGWTTVVIYAERFGTNRSGISVNYRINNFMNDDADANEEMNNDFPLQPGSDYATPTPAIQSPIQGTNSDFVLAQGTLTFPGSGNNANFQPISFTVTNSMLTKFNRDFKITLYHEVSVGGQNVPAMLGMVAETTVTILFNDQHPPAGSVDQLYNADFNTALALPYNQKPQTTPGNNNVNPGVSGVVNSMLVLPNDKTMIAGDFDSYNGGIYTNGNFSIGGIALIDTNGNLDYSFVPNSGADAPIHALASAPNNQYIIGGEFTSFNGVGQYYVARLNANGSLDGTFNPPVNGTVRAVAVQPDGKILIGGDFQDFNGCDYLARLNTDGTPDTTFNPGTTLSGPVEAIALPAPPISFSNSANNSTNEADQTVNLGLPTSGLVTINYNMSLQPGDLQVYYGGTNGTLIFDTGSVSGFGNLSVAFGPTNGITTNVLTVVMNPGGAPLPATWNYTGTVTFGGGNGILVGGSFSVNGQNYANIARFNSNGTLDSTFNPVAGSDNAIEAMALQPDGKIVVGGLFTTFNGVVVNHITRLNSDGSLDTGFFSGSGADNEVRSITLQADGTMYVGGLYGNFNGTHRLGFARLYYNGTVDTTFMDTAYNQFAGLKRIYSYDTPAVYCSGVQSDGKVMIGGTFDQVGGGQANTNVCGSLDYERSILPSSTDPNLWVEPKTRDGVRNRSSVARLIGGSTPGPGNIGLTSSSASANKSQSSLSVGLVRNNGYLGPIAANFTVLSGTAQGGVDYVYNAASPIFWVAWNYITTPTRCHVDGLFGINGFLQDIYNGLSQSDSTINNLSAITVSIINNLQSSGNLNAQFQLSNPSGADEFYLGGQNIPLGTALGISSAAFTLIDDNKQSGASGFSSSNYVTTGLLNPINLVRSNGVYGDITMRCFVTNGTAIPNVDYRPITNLAITIKSGKTTNFFTFTNLNSGLSSTNFVEKNAIAHLVSLTGPVDGNPTFGISNAVIRLINNNFIGYLTLGAAGFTNNETAGFITFVVNRVAGNSGSISVQYATTNGTAINGVDYVGTTNVLLWNNGDSTPRLVSIPLLNNGAVGVNKSFGVNLRNPTNGVVSAPGLFYAGSPPNSITNATLMINDDNSYGTFQFSAPSYLASENGGYATITVLRTGGIAGPISVNYATSNGSNTLAGVNYVATNGVLTFAVNQIAASFNVPLIDDGISDPTNFYFNVSLSNPVNATLGSPSNAIVNIFDYERHLGQTPGSPDQPFNPSFNGDVLTLALQPNGQILAGGNFTAVNGTPFGSIARLNPDGSPDSGGFLNSPINNGVNGIVQSLICQTDGSIVIGGSFSAVDTVARNNIARVKSDGSLDTSFNPGFGANASVYAVAEAFVGGSRRIYVGGGFSTISGGSSPNFARLYGQNVGGTSAGALDPFYSAGSGPNGTVYAIAVYPTNSVWGGEVLIGGAFTNVNGLVENHLARMNVDGSVDATFGTALTINDTVRAIAIQNDGRILIGGDFTNINGTALNHIARLNSDGSVDASFTTNVGVGADATVNAIGIQADNRIVLGGQFAHVNGVTRNRITRLLPSGAFDPNINFGTGANGPIDALLIQPGDQKLVIGGGFTQYDGQLCQHIARIYGGSMSGSGALQFTVSDYQVDERGAQALITVSRTGGTSGPNPDGSGNISVQFKTSDGSAIAGVNYTAVNTTLIFPPGEVLESVPVLVSDDGIVTSNLIANLTLSNITPPATNGVQIAASLHIINDDSAVSFSNANYSVAYNISGGVANIDIVRVGTNGTSSVDFYATTNGTAVNGVDFYPTNTTVTFTNGQSDQQVQVQIINNSTPSGAYLTVPMLLTNPVNTVLASPSNSTITIIAANAPGQISFESTNYSAHESDGIAQITLVRTNGTQGTVSVQCSTVQGTGPNAAQPNVDYLPTSSQVSFAGNDTVAYFYVPLVQNSHVQPPVYLPITMSPLNGSNLIAPTNATLNIISDNSGFVFLNVTNYFRETNGTISVLVQRVGSTATNASVKYFTANGTALAGRNYNAVNNTLDFNPGESIKGISVPLLYYPRVTGDLNFLLCLTNPSAGALLGSPSNSVIVVQDADAGLSFATNNTSVLKHTGVVAIPVICSNPGVEPVVTDTNVIPLSVNFSTADGTATAGVDYTATNGVLVFTNGIGTNYFNVTITANGLVNGNHAFSVNLSQPTFPGQLAAPSNEVVTIVDDNSGLSFSSPNYTVIRDGGVPAAVNVVRTDYTNTTSTVNFTTVDGTGVAGLDYIATNGVLTFTNGVTNQIFYVWPIGNSIVQPDRTVLLELSNPVNGVFVTPYTATLTIHDTSGSVVVPAGSAFTANGDPNHNGLIDPNETVSLMFGFRAGGGTNIGNLVATLLPTSGITSPSGPQSYGSLAVGGPSVSRQFSFTANGTNGQLIVATFSLQDASSSKNLGTNLFTYSLGSWTTVYSNTAPIIINDNTFASPYPSGISVSGAGGMIIKATVTLTNVWHTSPSDIDALLVAPNQQDTLIMAHAGAQNVIRGVTLAFDDAATNSLPQNSVIVTGTNKPTAYLPIPPFP